MSTKPDKNSSNSCHDMSRKAKNENENAVGTAAEKARG